MASEQRETLSDLGESTLSDLLRHETPSLHNMTDLTPGVTPQPTPGLPVRSFTRSRRAGRHRALTAGDTDVEEKREGRHRDIARTESLQGRDLSRTSTFSGSDAEDSYKPHRVKTAPPHTPGLFPIVRRPSLKEFLTINENPVDCCLRVVAIKHAQPSLDGSSLEPDRFTTSVMLSTVDTILGLKKLAAKRTGHATDVEVRGSLFKWMLTIGRWMRSSKLECTSAAHRCASKTSCLPTCWPSWYHPKGVWILVSCSCPCYMSVIVQQIHPRMWTCSLIWHRCRR